MFFLRNKFNFIVVVFFLASCSSMNVTEEKVYSGDVKTVKASSTTSSNINYDSMAVFANATVYFELPVANIYTIPHSLFIGHICPSSRYF